MPYNIFLTVRRSREFDKARAVYVGRGGESETVLYIEDPTFLPAAQILDELFMAIEEHMKVRREGQRRDRS